MTEHFNMNNTEKKLTTSDTTIDKSVDSCDLLSILNIIEHLYYVSCRVINNYSETAVLVSLAVEVQTLLTKLRAMSKRWSVHIPFKEATSVDFIKWSNRAVQLSNEIRSADFRTSLTPGDESLSSHCLIDLYHEAKQTLDECTETTDTTDPKLLLKYHEAMQEELTNQRERCIETISQMIYSQFSEEKDVKLSGMQNIDTVRDICSSLLMELASELDSLHEQQVKIFNPKDYERLAYRILYEPEYEGQIARREARDSMRNWRNGVPEGKLEESLKEQIEHIKEEIRHTKHGVKLEQYVNLDADFYDQRSEFGRFLFNRRRDITRTELRQLIYLVYCVYYYQTDGLQETDKPKTEIHESDTETTKTYPPLPVEFNQQLRENQIAMNCFYGILCRVEPYINNNGYDVAGSSPELCTKYKDWTWYHLQTAFEKLRFLPGNSSKKPFSSFINSLFPHRKESSVNRALYRNSNLNSPNIVADVVKEFQPVLTLMSSSKTTSDK